MKHFVAIVCNRGQILLSVWPTWAVMKESTRELLPLLQEYFLLMVKICPPHFSVCLLLNQRTFPLANIIVLNLSIVIQRKYLEVTSLGE